MKKVPPLNLKNIHLFFYYLTTKAMYDNLDIQYKFES